MTALYWLLGWMGVGVCTVAFVKTGLINAGKKRDMNLLFEWHVGSERKITKWADDVIGVVLWPIAIGMLVYTLWYNKDYQKK